MTMEKQFIFLTSDKSRQANSRQLSKIKTPVVRSPSYDCEALFGLLLLLGLTGIAAFSMVVDITAMAQVFRPEAPSPVERQYEVVKR